jgi:hypothetical protein
VILERYQPVCMVAQPSCERLLTLSSGIYRYAEYMSVVTFEHFSSKRLSAKDSDRGIPRSPKIDEQFQQRRNLTVLVTALKNQRCENICCYKSLEERLMIEWE